MVSTRSALTNGNTNTLTLKLGAHWIGSALPGPARPGSVQANVRALLRFLSASETSYCRKTHKTLPRIFGNVLLCPAFRNCSDTFRRGSVAGRADAVHGLLFVSIEFISADCAIPSRAHPIQCAPSLTQRTLTDECTSA
jgi:hypothetical protein